MLIISGCSEQSSGTPETKEKVIKEVVVVIGDDGKVYVPNEDLGEADEVVYKLEDGTEVSITTESDLSVSGEYEAEVSYVKDGETVTESTTVLSDTQEKIEEALEEAKQASTKLAWGDLGYGDAEINGVVYGFDDLNDMDWDTSIAWAEAVYGSKDGYRIVPCAYPDGTLIDLIGICVYDGMPCEEMTALAWGLRGEKGWITLDAVPKLSALEACGLA